MRLPADEISCGSVGVEGNAVERDDAELLRYAFIQDCEIEVGDRGGVEYAPELALLRLHLDRGGRVVGIGNRHEIDGEVFRGLAEAGAVVGGVAVVVHQEFGHDGFGFRWRRVGIQQILIADDQDAFGQSGYFFIGALDSFDDHCSGGAAQDL